MQRVGRLALGMGHAVAAPFIEVAVGWAGPRWHSVVAPGDRYGPADERQVRRGVAS